MDALRELIEDGTLGLDALQYFSDFVAFSVALNKLDRRKTPPRESYRDGVDPGYFHFLRADDELEGVFGESVRGEARFAADGTLDVISWSRRQFDGPAAAGSDYDAFLAAGKP